MSLKNLFFGLGFCVLAAASIRAEIVDVAENEDIQTAINGADAGDVVHLKGSEYRISQELTLGKGITLLGADDASSVVITNTSGSSRVITIGHPDAVVSGVTLTGGIAGKEGGGVYMTAGLLTNCVVRGNRINSSAKQDLLGGGVYLNVAKAENAKVVDCVIADNGHTSTTIASARILGAGICGKSTAIKPEVVGCTISGNKTSTQNSRAAGACYVTLKDCVIEGNENSGQNSYGGGITESVAYRCIVRNNRAVGTSNTGMGSGARQSTCYDCLFTGNYSFGKQDNDGTVHGGTYYNCTIVGNTCSAGASAGTSSSSSSGATILYNCIVADNYIENGGALSNFRTGNEPTCYNTAISPIGPDSPLRDGGNSDADPKLNADFTLGASWCVDAGDDSKVVDDDRAVDLAGNPRKVGAHVDLGCYEKQSVVDGELAVSVDSDTVTGAAGFEVMLSATVVAPMGKTVTLVWDFGDGSTAETSCEGAGVAEPVHQPHSYTVGGMYDLKVTASMMGAEDVEAFVAEKVRVQADGNLFVSTSGDDANTGLSADVPKKTLRCAAKAAKPGATVTLLPGTHTVSEDVVIDGGVTVVANPGAVFEGRSGFAKIVLQEGTLRNCVFRNVSVGDNSKLLNIQDLNKLCLIDKCRFENVTCGYLAFPATARENYQFRDCEFTGCTIKQYGVQKCYVYRCVFTDNTVANALTIDCNVYDSLYMRNKMTDSDNAGVIRNGTSVNCTLAFNIGQPSKKAILFRQGKHYNDLIFCNTNQDATAMMLCKKTKAESTSFTPTLSNCWVDDQSYNENYFTAGTYPCLTGADPLIKADGQLKSGSPCIDAGKMDYYTSSYKSDVRTHDVFGKMRVKNDKAVIDIGCAEFASSGLLVYLR